MTSGYRDPEFDINMFSAENLGELYMGTMEDKTTE
jgi:hypothetical protein